MGRIQQQLAPKKQRMQMLLDGVAQLEAVQQKAKPITVIRYAPCGHACCGDAMPDVVPDDALIVTLGCKYDVPSVTPPPGVEANYRSRVERQHEMGVSTGLGEEAVKKTIQAIRLLNR